MDDCPWFPCGGVDCCIYGDPECEDLPDRDTDESEDDGLDYSLSRLPESELGGW